MSRSCVNWKVQRGGWTTPPLLLSEERWASSGWDRGGQLVIMGGLGVAARRTSETVYSDGAVNSRSFLMKYERIG